METPQGTRSNPLQRSENRVESDQPEASHNGRESIDVSPEDFERSNTVTGDAEDVVSAPRTPAHEEDEATETTSRKLLEHLTVIGCHIRYGFDWLVFPGLRKRNRAALDELWHERKTKKIYAFLNSKGSSGKTAGSTTAGVLYADAIKRDCVAVDMNDSPGGTARRLGVKRKDTLNLREYLKRYKGGEYHTAESIGRQMQWTREAGLFVISSEAVANTKDDHGRDLVKLGLEQLAESVHSVFCDLGNGIKSLGNWSAVEIADTLVFMGNVNAADSVVDFKKDDPTGEGDDLKNTMSAYSDLKMTHKVQQGIIVILGAKASMRQRYADHYGYPKERVFVVPNNRYMKRGNVVKKNRLPLRVRVVIYEILVAMVKAERPPQHEIMRVKDSHGEEEGTETAPEGHGLHQATRDGDTETIPVITFPPRGDADSPSPA